MYCNSLKGKSLLANGGFGPPGIVTKVPKRDYTIATMGKQGKSGVMRMGSFWGCKAMTERELGVKE